jgi:hypothetical protein
MAGERRRPPNEQKNAARDGCRGGGVSRRGTNEGSSLYVACRAATEPAMNRSAAAENRYFRWVLAGPLSDPLIPAGPAAVPPGD